MIDKGIANGKYIETNNTAHVKKERKNFEEKFFKKRTMFRVKFLKNRNLASYLSIK